jgi:hypothetical protein
MPPDAHSATIKLALTLLTKCVMVWTHHPYLMLPLLPAHLCSGDCSNACGSEPGRPWKVGGLHGALDLHACTPADIKLPAGISLCELVHAGVGVHTPPASVCVCVCVCVCACACVRARARACACTYVHAACKQV